FHVTVVQTCALPILPAPEDASWTSCEGIAGDVHAAAARIGIVRNLLTATSHRCRVRAAFRERTRCRARPCTARARRSVYRARSRTEERRVGKRWGCV